MQPMIGHLEIGGHRFANAGFMLPSFSPNGVQAIGPSIPIYTRASGLSQQSDEFIERMERFNADGVERVDLMGDLGSIQKQIGLTLGEMKRAITSTTTAFPVRENLEAPARNLVPTETPMRNRLPRTVGAGTASQWRQIVSMGGGFGFATTTSSAGAVTAPVLASTAGIKVGDVVQFITATTGVPIGGTVALSLRTVTAVTATTITVASVTVVSGDLIVNTGNATQTAAGYIHGRPAGAGVPAGITAATYFGRNFYAETGAPAEKQSSYIAQSKGYKLMGTFGSVTGFAMAAGANFQPQLAAEKRQALQNLMLNEENSILNGSSTSLLPPWGDFANALGYDGMVNSIATTNGTPADQIQTSVGALTLSHIDNQLRRIADYGGQDQYIVAAGQEILSLVHLAEAAGSIIRFQATTDGSALLGLRVAGYVHPVTGQICPVIYSRFLEPGTMIFGSDRLPDGTSAADINVLPQVELPALEPTEALQGYVARELAVTTSAVDVHPFCVTLYSVYRQLGGTVFAKSSGLTAV
jgi:hypothetical protein